MRNYELLYIVSNQYTEDELGKIKLKIDEQLKKNGGVLGYHEMLGKRKLAYPINKFNHGYYVVSEFELEDGSKLKAINENLRLDKEILRAQIVTKEKITPEEIVKLKAQREANPENETASGETEERPAPKTVKPVKAEKKADIKNLDEKLDEILQEEVI